MLRADLSTRARARHRVVLVTMIAIFTVRLAAACGAGLENADGGRDGRLVGNVLRPEVNLGDPIETDEIEDVLSCSVGGAGGAECSTFFVDGESAITSDVGFLGDDAGGSESRYRTDRGTIGETTAVCIRAATPEASVTLPDVAEIDFPDDDGERAAAGGVEVIRVDFDTFRVDSELGDGQSAQFSAYEIRTFPGAPVGTYEVNVALSDVVSFDVTSSDDGTDGLKLPNIFLYDRYIETSVITRAQPGDEIAYGFIQFEPGEVVPVALYRSDERVDAMEESTYHLVDRFEVPMDGRGQAALALTVTEGSRGHCFFLLKEADLQYVEPEYGLVNGGDFDARTLCVARS